MDRRGQVFGLAVAILATAGFTAPAFAGAPPPATAVNWTGFYLGGDVGAVFNTTTLSQPGTAQSDTSVGTIAPRPAFGVHGGFNYQVAPWAVVGIEGAYTWLSGTNYNYLGPSTDFLLTSRNMSSVAGRFGVLLTPDTMVYGKVGPAWIETEGFDGFAGPFKRTLPAVQAGVGIETLVTPNIAVRAEASYTKTTEDLSLSSGSFIYRPSILLLNVGASYKFDAPAGWGNPGSARDAGPFAWAPAATGRAAPKWTGVEVGGFVSANGNRMRFFDTVLGESGPYSDIVAGGGWFVGANYQIQHAVVGIEVSDNYENANFYYPSGSGSVPPFFRFASVKSVLAVTARAGWLMTPDTLLYVKGGPAYIRVKPDGDYWNSIAPNATGTTTLAGYQVGLGAETYVMSNVSVRVEGLYTRANHGLIFQGTVPNEFSIQPSVLSATLGVAYHFF